MLRAFELWLDVKPDACPIPWRPNAMAPVFYGYHDVSPDLVAHPGDAVFLRVDTIFDGLAPTTMRILFPTLDGSPQHAQILRPCGQYPLVVLVHGECKGAQKAHYLHWALSRLPSQLARAGYVVAIPQWSGSTPQEAEVDLMRDVVSWMRSGWQYANVLAPPPATGLVGHSRGGVLAGMLAGEGNVRAFVSLSGDWHQVFGDPTIPQAAIAAAKLFVRGAPENDELGRWNDIPAPKYRAIMGGTDHFDYLAPAVAPCEDAARGACSCSHLVAADLVTMFLARHLPPPDVPSLPSEIPPSLVRGLGDLSLQQEFYAGSYLRGFECLDETCTLELTFSTAGDGEGTATFPAQ